MGFLLTPILVYHIHLAHSQPMCPLTDLQVPYNTNMNYSNILGLSSFTVHLGDLALPVSLLYP